MGAVAREALDSVSERTLCIERDRLSYLYEEISDVAPRDGAGDGIVYDGSL